MSCTLLFNDRGWDILTTSWTAGARNSKETDIRYTWGADGIGWTNQAVSTARHKVALPFNIFARYVQDCQGKNIIADLNEHNLPRIRAQYAQTQTSGPRP